MFILRPPQGVEHIQQGMDPTEARQVLILRPPQGVEHDPEILERMATLDVLILRPPQGVEHATRKRGPIKIDLSVDSQTAARR